MYSTNYIVFINEQSIQNNIDVHSMNIYGNDR